VELQLSFFLNSPQERSKTTITGYLKDLDIKSVAGDKDLKTVYDAIFDRNTAPNDIERQYATLIYQLMICSKQSIDIELAVAAISSVRGDNHFALVDEDRGLPSVHNMIRDFAIVTPGGKLTFAHHSVIEYLQRQHKAEYSGANPDAKVALTCLNTLSNCPRAGYQARLGNDAFFQYCHQFWGYHCSKLSKQKQDELGLTEALRNWIMNPTGLGAFVQQCRECQQTLRTAINCERYQLPGDMDTNPMFACSIWNLEGLLRQLMYPGCGPELNRSQQDKRRPLAWAAACGHESIVNILLDHGAEANHRENYTFASALDLAASHGHARIVRKLIQHGAEIVYKGKDNEWEHPLHLAAMHGHAEVVGDLLKALASKGENLNPLYRITDQRDISETGSTSNSQSLVNVGSPLSRASEYGQEDVVEVLLNHRGTQVDFRTDFGETPLMLAAHGCHKGVLQRLIQKGADVNARDNKGRTALMKAAASGFSLEVIRLLLACKGLKAEIADKEGLDAIDWARTHYTGNPYKDQLDIACLLAEAGVPADWDLLISR
jgi:ankyrin repeat protein